jgi:hypothetical protein
MYQCTCVQILNSKLNPNRYWLRATMMTASCCAAAKVCVYKFVYMFVCGCGYVGVGGCVGVCVYVSYVSHVS